MWPFVFCFESFKEGKLHHFTVHNHWNSPLGTSFTSWPYYNHFCMNGIEYSSLSGVNIEACNCVERHGGERSGNCLWYNWVLHYPIRTILVSFVVCIIKVREFRSIIDLRFLECESAVFEVSSNYKLKSQNSFSTVVWLLWNQLSSLMNKAFSPHYSSVSKCFFLGSFIFPSVHYSHKFLALGHCEEGVC